MIQEQKPMSDLEFVNMSVLLKRISSPLVIKILFLIHKQACTYSEISKNIGITKGTLAFYLRKLVSAGIVNKDRINNSYSLTFKGMKAVQFMTEFRKLANLTIATPEHAKAMIRLEQNKTWLEPIIREEIKAAVTSILNTKEAFRQ